MQTFLTWIRLPLFIAGILLFFVGERYLAAESYFTVLRAVALGLSGIGFFSTLILSFLARQQDLAEESKSWQHTLFWQLGLLASLGIYIAYRSSMGEAANPESFAQKALLAGWVLLLVLSLASGAGFEWARRENGKGKFAEPQRVVRSGLAWLLVGMLLSSLVAINYTASQKDIVRDWSYLKVTSPSQSTGALLKTLTEDLQIGVFYPGGNEVLIYLKQYLDQVAALEPKVKISYYDKDLNPTKAEELKVSRNGNIVLEFGGKRSKIDAGTTLEKARKILRSLDQEFQKAFREITAAKKTIYFTRGHGELSWTDEKDDELRSITLLESVMRQQAYSLKRFGIGEGSATAIPDDAAAVVIAGPTLPFQKEEAEALKAYVEKGGSVMIFFDIAKEASEVASVQANGEDPLRGFTESVGIKFFDTPLGNDKNFVAATRSPADHWFLFTNSFASHESVVSLSRHDERIALLVFQSGYLAVTPKVGDWKAAETVRSLSDTYVDENRNFTFDPGNQRKPYVMGAAAEFKPAQEEGSKAKAGRVVVVADATAISDALIRNPGNFVFVADSLKWIMGEEALAGPAASEEDVKIRHTRKEDVIYFHATVIAVPLLVLGAGYFATRRRRSVASSGKAAKQEKTDAA